MKAHVFALCLSLSLCLGLPLPALAFASPFTDVQETSPYYDAILWAAETGVTNGTTASTFSPDAPCTRAQLAVFLWRAAGEPKPALAEQQFMDVTDPSAYYYGAVQWAAEKDMWGFGTFAPHAVCTRLDAVFFLWRAAGSPAPKGTAKVPADVLPGSYCYDAVAWALENGITKGTSDTTFSPDATCSRAQIVAFLWRSEKSPAAGTANPFADVKSTAYYADAVLWAVKENITKGTTSTTFSPNADCTRAQIVTFLWRCKK